MWDESLQTWHLIKPEWKGNSPWNPIADCYRKKWQRFGSLPTTCLWLLVSKWLVAYLLVIPRRRRQLLFRFVVLFFARKTSSEGPGWTLVSDTDVESHLGDLHSWKPNHIFWYSTATMGLKMKLQFLIHMGYDKRVCIGVCLLTTCQLRHPFQATVKCMERVQISSVNMHWFMLIKSCTCRLSSPIS